MPKSLKRLIFAPFDPFPMRQFVLLGSVLIMIACSSSPPEKPTLTNPSVRHFGALKEIMHKGDLSSRININSLSDSTHVYGLGALKDLKGEILIWDSQPYMAEVEDSILKIDESWNRHAALLVYSQVAEWEIIELTDGFETLADLERLLAQHGHAQGLDTNKAFPFLLKGTFGKADWHVINWPEGDTEHSHAKHIASGLHGSEFDVQARVLGFYSQNHKAVYTHHTRFIHMHLFSDDGKILGHADDLQGMPSLQLYLPKS